MSGIRVAEGHRVIEIAVLLELKAIFEYNVMEYGQMKQVWSDFMHTPA